MTLEAFTEKALRKDALRTIERANEILGEYEGEGYTLTLRQLYYQFVARGLLANTEQSYQMLSRVITDGRMTGLVSWDAIEDRGREHVAPYIQESQTETLQGIQHHLALNFWENQDTYIEILVEKDALINVVERPANTWRLPHMACRGYMSASAMYACGKRFEEAAMAGKRCIMIHLGDHDPSGIDMTRDNGERASLFSYEEIEVVRLALNRDQVDQYNPPPNPTKVTDTRAADYIKRFGHTCWELDALRPQVIAALIENEIRRHVDIELWNEKAAEEAELRADLREISINSTKFVEIAKRYRRMKANRDG